MRYLASSAAALLLLSASSDPRAAWSTNPSQNHAVSLARGRQHLPAAISDGRGGALIVFMDTRDSAILGVDIYAQHIDAHGNRLWARDGEPVFAMPGDQWVSGRTRYSIASDGAGGIFVTCRTIRSGPPIPSRLQRVDAKGTAMWGDSGIAPLPVTSANGRLVPDGRGGVFASWFGNNQIGAQHVDADGALLWGPEGVTMCSSRMPQFQMMIPDETGGVVVTWADYRASEVGSLCDIYAQRLDGAGVSQWTPNGVALTNGPGRYSEPRLCTDGAGGAIVAWRDFATELVCVERVTASGVASWIKNRVRLTTNDSEQWLAKLVSDGAGGAILGWSSDACAGAISDYYVQRLDASGARLWGDDGKPLCVAPGSQYDLDMISDGEDGVMAVWSDRRVSNTRALYAQRIGPNGSPLWAPDGVRVTGTEPGERDQPVIVASGDGIIVAFTEWRGMDADIYALRLSADGGLGTGVRDVEPGSGPRKPIWFRVVPLPATHDVDFSFDLDSAGPVSLDVFDVLGRLLRRIDMKVVTPGAHSLTWDLRAGDGRCVPGGVYLARLKFAGRSRVTRVLVVN